MTYLLIETDGSIQDLPADTSFDDIRKRIGGWAEMVSTPEPVEGARISAYIDEEATLKPGIPANEVASKLFGQPLLGPVVVVGPYDAAKEVDTALSPEQVEHIRSL